MQTRTYQDSEDEDEDEPHRQLRNDTLRWLWRRERLPAVVPKDKWWAVFPSKLHDKDSAAAIGELLQRDGAKERFEVMMGHSRASH